MSENSAVDLVWLGATWPVPEWPLGQVYPLEATLCAVQALIERQLTGSKARAWLFWDARLGAPNPASVTSLLELPGNVFHAGLRLGMGGKPGIVDFVHPTWMFNRDPDVAIEATSWRMSLSACLIPTDVLRQMGGVDPGFATLECAALEMGHRYLVRGVFVRHVPWMIPDNTKLPVPQIPFADEVRFLRCRFRRWQVYWALARALLTRYASPLAIVRGWRATAASVPLFTPPPYKHVISKSARRPKDARVSVLIPTLDRYPYLRTVLAQLRTQTVLPFEVIVIDQTDKENRDLLLLQDFADLPLRIIYLDEPGQCSARNAGLQIARGDYILFIDDDDEIENDLIERHWNCLSIFRGSVSSGYARIRIEEPQPENFSFIRASDVFPTGNTLIKRCVLQRSGLFDLAYDRGQNEDHDLGMRVYLSGQLMVYNPAITVLHHHAPRGGLRAHRARVITYAGSRHSLIQRHLPSVSEIYLAKRYFSERQVRESLWLRAFGTFVLRGSMWRKMLKVIISGVLLPNTIWRIHKAVQQADKLLEEYPQIPTLD